MRRNARFLPAAVLAVAATLAAVWLLGRRSPSVQLAHGTVLSVSAVTVGTVHVAEPPGTFDVLARRWPWLATRFPRMFSAVTPMSWQSPRTNLTVALRVVPLADRRSPVAGAIAPFAYGGMIELVPGFTLVGPSGNGFPSANVVPIPGAQPGSEYLVALFDVFPRRERSLRLRFRGRNGTIHELPVTLPPAGPFPTWTAGPLPREVTTNGVTFRLEWVERGPALYAPLRAGFSAWRDGVRAGEWSGSVVTVGDATGNENPAGVDPGEAVWNLVSRWHRAPRWDGSEPTIRLRGIRIEPPGEWSHVESEGTLGPATVRAYTTLGPGTYVRAHGVPLKPDDGRVDKDERTTTFREPFVCYRVAGLPPDHVLAARGWDDQGRLVDVDMTDNAWGRGFVIHAGPGAKSVDIEVADLVPHEIEFRFEHGLGNRAR